MNPSTRTTDKPPATRLMTLGYLALSIIGLVGTWWFNLRFDPAEVDGVDSYLEGWFVNAASSSAAVDIIVMAVVASVFMLAESHRLDLRRSWTIALVVASPFTAIAFTFPLYLAWRTHHLGRRADIAPTESTVSNR